jgi:hypothetical protein
LGGRAGSGPSLRSGDQAGDLQSFTSNIPLKGLTHETEKWALSCMVEWSKKKLTFFFFINRKTAYKLY